MYRWYENSEICIAYLHDVPDAAGVSGLQLSDWFLRGWTLQELIAPRSMASYSRECSFLGTKNHLVRELEEISKIPYLWLLHRAPDGDLSWASVAER